MFPADLVTYTEEIFNGKLHSLRNDRNMRKNKHTEMHVKKYLCENIKSI